MKVEQPQDDRNGRVTRVTSDPVRSPIAQAGPTQTDAVRLSGDVHLVDRAVRAALAGDVRAGEVSRARALFEAGQVGDDPVRLADRLIDALTESHDDTA
jgi:hypothetical protein